MEACTVTALDAITAFAVPNPNNSSQSSRFFRVWLPAGLPQRTGSPSLLWTGQRLIFSQPFQPSTRATLNSELMFVNADYWCKLGMRWSSPGEMQSAEDSVFIEWENRNVELLHNIMHSLLD